MGKLINIDHLTTSLSATKDYIAKKTKVNDNLIRNGRFAGAKSLMRNKGIDAWVMWGTQVHELEPYSSDERHLNLDTSIGDSEGRGGIYQYLLRENVPQQNETLTLSFYCNWQSNARTPSFDITYYNKGVQLTSQYIRHGCQKGENVFTFTTPNEPFDEVIIGIIHDGTVSDSIHDAVLHLNRFKLEAGGTATPWVENSHYANTILDAIKQSGGGNLLKNSSFIDSTRHWSFYSWDSSNLSELTYYTWAADSGNWSHANRFSLTAFVRVNYSGAPINGIISSEWCAVTPNETYSYSFYCRQHRCQAYVEIQGLQFDGNYRTIYAFDIEPYIGGDQNDRSFDTWRYTGNSFTIPSDVKAITFWIVITNHDIGGGDDQNTAYFWLMEPCIVRSPVPTHWVPHENEILDGIVRVDNERISVRHDYCEQISNSHGQNFFVDGQTEADVPGLFIHARNWDGSLEGSVVGNDAVNISIANGAEHRAGIVVRENQNNTNKAEVHVWGHLDMHKYNISNSGWVNAVSASTEYTRRLINEGSIDNFNYGTMSYNADEIRWCWRETVFTYPECDIDPETDEWIYTGRNVCYVELPIFLAESIQNDYHIQVGKIGWGDYRIIEKTPYYFILESEQEDFAFTFEIVAKLQDKHTEDNNASIAAEYAGVNGGAIAIVGEYDHLEEK